MFPSNFVEIIEDDEVTPQQEKTAGGTYPLLPVILSMILLIIT